jgi:RecA/RadA recombinase
MPKAKKKTKSEPAPFNLLSSDIVAHTQEGVHALRSRKKNSSTTLKSMADIKPYLMEIDIFALQMILGIRGLRGRTVTEIIAQEGIGKTTLCFTLLGALMRSVQSPPLYINTEGENKLPNAKRIKRCLDRNPAVAEQMYNIIQIDNCYEVRQMTESIEDFAKATRQYLDENGAKDVPIVVVVDTLSKLMSPTEAVGLLDSDSSKSSKAKALGEGSNFESAKLLHAWGRQLNAWFDKYNLVLISVSHQNQKIDMSGFGSPMSADVSAGYNKTKRGGKAMDQNAALQLTLKRIGFHKNSQQEPIGHKIEMRVVKSSVSPDNNTIQYALKTKDFLDTAEYQEPALDFTEGLANMFVEQKILGTKVLRKRYTSDELGVEGVTAMEFCEAFDKRPDLQHKVGVMLGIEGYTPDEWLDDANLAAESVTEDGE